MYGNDVAFPGGTVTFLFTDIEGSTRLLQELGEDYGEVVADHRRILRGVFQKAGGHEVDTQGDAFFYSFTRARDAVIAAVDGQRALAEHTWPSGAEVRDHELEQTLWAVNSFQPMLTEVSNARA